jgi:polysaccharide export outer membrane protein
MESKRTFLIALLVFFGVAIFLPRESHPGREYAVGPGDVLTIKVWGNEDLTGEFVISAEGGFRFPLIGEVRAAGHSVDELGRIVSERLADGYLVDPQVEVVIKEYRSQKVFVLGEVVRPGTYPLDSRATLIEIISKAGGLGPEAGDSVEIVRARENWERNKPLRPGQEGVGEVVRVDLLKLLGGKINTKRAEVRNGDTIFIPKGRVFYIYGEVKNPGKYTWEKDLTVLKAVIVAGGFSEIASKRRVKIRRQDSDGEKKIRVTLETKVEPGDTVIVPESFF